MAKPLLLTQLDITRRSEDLTPIIRENFRRIEENLNNLDGSAEEVNQTINVSTGTDVWVRGTAIINPAQTVAIDTVPLADFFSLRYNISLYNLANSLTKTFELNIIKVGSTLRDSISNRIGTGSLSVNVTVVGLNAEIQITNSEVFRIDVDFAKLDL